jgi:mannitol/fructose-specific phosphotransferase system IIA component (Ntr-type)
MAIALADLLDEKQVILRLRSRKPANALREIVRLLAENGRIDQPEKFLGQVLAREQVHPSVVEQGVVLPHMHAPIWLTRSFLASGAAAPAFPLAKMGCAPT